MKTAVLSNFAVLLLVVFAAGCGESLPETYPVTGVVTLNGKPVEGADVALVPNNPELRSAGGMTDAEGKFSVKTYFDPEHQPEGAMAGDYGITVSKTSVAKPPDGMKPEEMMAFAMKNGMPKPLLPSKYTNPKSSGFNVSVKADAPTAPLKLELQGKGG